MAIRTVPTASITIVAAPAPARICVGSTAGSQTGPNSHGTTTGASTTSDASSGNSTTASMRTMRRRRANRSSEFAVRESTGNATEVMIALILRWYSTASWKPRQ